jgi:hypothetical protein
MVSAKGGRHRLDPADVGRLGGNSSGDCSWRVRGEARPLTHGSGNAGRLAGSVSRGQSFSKPTPRLHPDVIEILDDQSLLEVHSPNDGHAEDAILEALLAEINRRGLKV